MKRILPLNTNPDCSFYCNLVSKHTISVILLKRSNPPTNHSAFSYNLKRVLSRSIQVQMFLNAIWLHIFLSISSFQMLFPYLTRASHKTPIWPDSSRYPIYKYKSKRFSSLSWCERKLILSSLASTAIGWTSWTLPLGPLQMLSFYNLELKQRRKWTSDTRFFFTTDW